MNDDRLRQPIDPDYLIALGTATYCFAVCEWNAVYCAEKIRPGSLQAFIGDALTAGKIANKLADLVRNMPKSSEREELVVASAEFTQLVLLRNNIIHGKPCTGPNGNARLFHKVVLEVSDLNDAADAFSSCSIELNRLFHGFLSTYVPQ